MYIVPVLSASIAATALMSFYMFIVALFSGKEYRIPFVLGSMFSEKSTAGNLMDYSLRTRIIGTVIHYFTGALFALAFLFLWRREWIDLSVESMFLYGVIIGITGIVVWRIFFFFHPFAVRINLKKYLFHLFIAHLVFAAVLVYVFGILTKDVLVMEGPYGIIEM